MSPTPEGNALMRTGSARIGDEIDGRYRFVRVLGEGGMGTVYEGLHTRIGRRVAIKFLQPALMTNGDILGRFRREAQAAGSMEHENIAAVRDFGSAGDGSPYMVMEYLAGEDLAHLLVREGPLPVPRAVFMAIQACRGLDAAHARGIIHRDLKPENLFVSSRADGSDLVKILDFGIAKLREPQGGVITRTGAAMGTPYYMSIEQARGAKDIDHRTDIYSLGVILYELLSGQKPHPGETWNEIIYHILTQPPVPLDRLRPGLPEGLSALVHRAMDNDPAKRPSSVEEFASQLAPFAGRAVTPLRSQVVLEVAASADVTARREAAVPEPEPPSGIKVSTIVGTAVTGDAPAIRRSPRTRVGIAVGVVAAIGAVAIAVLGAAWCAQDDAGVVGSTGLSPSGLAPLSVPPEQSVASAAVSPTASAPASSSTTSAIGAGRTGGRPPGHGGSTPKPSFSETLPSPPVATNIPPPVITGSVPPAPTGKGARPYETANPYE